MNNTVWKKMKIKGTENDIVFVNKSGRPRYIEGEEFVQIYREGNEKQILWIKRSALMETR